MSQWEWITSSLILRPYQHSVQLHKGLMTVLRNFCRFVYSWEYLEFHDFWGNFWAILEILRDLIGHISPTLLVWRARQVFVFKCFGFCYELWALQMLWQGNQSLTGRQTQICKLQLGCLAGSNGADGCPAQSWMDGKSCQNRHLQQLGRSTRMSS